MSRIAALGLAVVTLSGCATMAPPSAEKLANLPVVEFPAAPPEGEFILRLPAGKPIPTRVLIDGTALASSADQTLSVTLPGDLYVHRRWVSADGKTWKPLKEMLDIRVALSLPSDEHPKPGELRLSVDRAKP
jgi:hypothetical protein